MHDVMTQNFRLISDLQKQLEKHMSNCSWRVVAKFGADAVEFRLFWVALKKKILKLCVCSEFSMYSGLQMTKGSLGPCEQAAYIFKAWYYSYWRYWKIAIGFLESLLGLEHTSRLDALGSVGHHYENNIWFSYRNADAPRKLVSVVQTNLWSEQRHCSNEYIILPSEQQTPKFL